MQDCKVNILGTEYSVLFRKEDEDSKLKKLDAYVDTSIKTIVVGIFESDETSIKDLEWYTKKLIRHEIIHAYMYESGLWENSLNVDAWARNEEMTDWFAIQLPKIVETFRIAGAT